MVYKTKGVCAQGIEFEIDDNKKVHNIKFTGGCSGNTQGVAHLAEAQPQVRTNVRPQRVRELRSTPTTATHMQFIHL